MVILFYNINLIPSSIFSKYIKNEGILDPDKNQINLSCRVGGNDLVWDVEINLNNYNKKFKNNYFHILTWLILKYIHKDSWKENLDEKYINLINSTIRFSLINKNFLLKLKNYIFFKNMNNSSEFLKYIFKENENFLNKFIRKIFTTIKEIKNIEIKLNPDEIKNVISKYEDYFFISNFYSFKKLNEGTFGIIYYLDEFSVMKCNKFKKENETMIEEIKFLNLSNNSKYYTKIKFYIEFKYELYGFEFSRYCIIMEKYDGNLYELMEDKNLDLYNLFFNNYEKNLKILKDSIKYLHDNNIIHNDIKLENIMYKKIYSVKENKLISIELFLGDFGLSEELKNREGKFKFYYEYKGTSIYLDSSKEFIGEEINEENYGELRNKLKFKDYYALNLSIIFLKNNFKYSEIIKNIKICDNKLKNNKENNFMILKENKLLKRILNNKWRVYNIYVKSIK